MADVEVKYENTTVTTVRGAEARSIAKWETQGWEFVSQTPAKLLRTTLLFRRPKQHAPRWAWIAGGAVLLIAVIGITIGALTEGRGDSDSAASPSASNLASDAPSVEPSPTPTTAPSVVTSAAPVTDAEVVSTFQTYFDERAASSVMVGKAVSKVSFENGVVSVTFDPAHAGVTQATFDENKGFSNLASFAATPIAFNDNIGNRIRPSVDSIETSLPDGASLGTFNHSQILALNGLPK